MTQTQRVRRAGPGASSAEQPVAPRGSDCVPNERRRELLEGLRRALDSLRAAGCRRAYLDGSFVAAKEEPGDFDACHFQQDSVTGERKGIVALDLEELS